MNVSSQHTLFERNTPWERSIATSHSTLCLCDGCGVSGLLQNQFSGRNTTMRLDLVKPGTPLVDMIRDVKGGSQSFKNGGTLFALLEQMTLV